MTGRTYQKFVAPGLMYWNMCCMLLRYGVGYHMVVTKEQHCSSSNIIQCVTDIIPSAEMVCITMEHKVYNDSIVIWHMSALLFCSDMICSDIYPK